MASMNIYRVRDSADWYFGIYYDQAFVSRHFDEAHQIAIEDISIGQLCELLDLEAEVGNYYGLVGVAKKIARTIATHSDENVAKKVLWDIAQQGGLQEL